MPIALPPPQLLEISGADALAFAHAQFGSDVRALADGRWQWSAWLSAQGRVRALFRLLRFAPDRLVLLLNGTTAASVHSSLERFVLRAKVRLGAIDAAAATGYFDVDEVLAGFPRLPEADEFVGADGSWVVAIPGGGRERWLAFGDPGSAQRDGSADAQDRWRAAEIESGIVELGDALSDRFLPAWLGLDRLGAVSVGKGCYPGQEIVARLHFKGGNKRWLHRIEFSAGALPGPGTALATAAMAEPPGELLAAAWTQRPAGIALAVLPHLASGTALSAPSEPAATFRVLSEIEGAAH